MRALKSTDIYMGQQNRAANPEELAQWSKEHQKAADALKSLGGNEFMHHFDYWNNHKQELQMLQASAALNNPMGESLMTNLSHNPFQDALDLQESMQLADVKGTTVKKLHESFDGGKKQAIAAAIANRIAEEVCESFTVKDHAGNVVHVAYSEGDAKRKAAAFAQKTGKPHSVAYAREQHPTK